jgi:hypothetical protein
MSLDRITEEPIEQINNDVMMLHETMEILHSIVEKQQPAFDTIEDTIIASTSNVQYASTQLSITDYAGYRWIQTGIAASMTAAVVLLFFL